MKVMVLGSGTSHGIPVVGCSCPVCTSIDPRDKRMRCSLYIEGPGEERLVIDTGPEFRLQALRAGIKKLDAVLLTHSHADHLHGLDDVRPLCVNTPLPVYGNLPTITELRERFSYVFNPNTQRGGGKPNLIPSIIEGPVRLGSLMAAPFPVKHGSLDILSWYISEINPGRPGQAPGSLLYMTDTSAIDKEVLAKLPQPEITIIGGLRARPHSTHFSFEEALETALKLKSRRVFLTHICHNHSHREIEEYCKNFMNIRGLGGIEMSPAWDGQEL